MLLSGQYVAKQNLPCFSEVPLAGSRLYLDRLEHKISRVDLAMRMRIRNPYHLPFVLKNQNVGDFRAIAQVEILVLPEHQKVFNLGSIQLPERDVVPWTVTDYTRDSGCCPAPKYSIADIDAGRRVLPDAGMIIIKEECS